MEKDAEVFNLDDFRSKINVESGDGDPAIHITFVGLAAEKIRADAKEFGVSEIEFIRSALSVGVAVVKIKKSGHKGNIVVSAFGLDKDPGSKR